VSVTDYITLYSCQTIHIVTAVELNTHFTLYRSFQRRYLYSLQENEAGQKTVVSSSYTWICLTGHRGTEVSVADANNLSVLLDNFTISLSHILCITGVPGTHRCSVQ